MSTLSWLSWVAALGLVFWVYQAVDLARATHRSLPPVTQRAPFENAPAPRAEAQGRHRRAA